MYGVTGVRVGAAACAVVASTTVLLPPSLPPSHIPVGVRTGPLERPDPSPSIAASHHPPFAALYRAAPALSTALAEPTAEPTDPVVTLADEIAKTQDVHRVIAHLSELVKTLAADDHDAAAKDDPDESDSLDEIAIGHETDDATPSPLVLLSGTASEDLAKAIAFEIGTPLIRREIGRFADGEVSVSVMDNVRGANVFVVQATSPPVNDNVVELLLTVSCLRRSSAKKITAVIPYYGYKRDVGRPAMTSSYASRLLHKQASEGGSEGEAADEDGGKAPRRLGSYPISAADIAQMLVTMGADHVLAIDMAPPGQGQMEGFFNIPVENIRTAKTAVRVLSALGLTNPVVVAPHEGCVQLASDVRSGLSRMAKSHGLSKADSHVGFAIMVGTQARSQVATSGFDRYLYDPTKLQEVRIVGEDRVRDKDVVIVDDIVDTGRTLVRRIKMLKEQGARNVYAFATHGLFNDGCLERISECDGLTEIIVTDTTKIAPEVRAHPKVRVVSIAPLLGEAIQKMHNGQSLHSLRVFDRHNTVERYLGQNS